MSAPRIPLLLAALLSASAFSGSAQTPRDAGEGIVLVKPQAWSKDSDATVLEFVSFSDRSAVGNAGAGYYEFKLKSGQTRQVPVSRASQVVVFPDASKITDIANQAERDKLAATIENLKGVTVRFPATKAYIDPGIKSLGQEIGRYDSGMVKIKGAWIPRKDYVSSQARELAKLIQSESGAPGGTPAPLESDPRFIALQEMGKENPEAKVLADKIFARHQFVLRASERKSVIEQLSDSGLDIEAARGLVKKLAGLNPGEDSASRAAFEKWDSAERQLAAAEKISAPAEKQLEEFLAGVTDPVAPPAIPADVISAADSSASKLQVLRGQGVPPQMEAALARASALSRYVATMRDLPSLLEKKSYFDADASLAAAVADGTSLGPNAERVAAALKQPVAAQIEIFVAARKEAESLQSLGKPVEALAKYRAAYAIIPDGSLHAKIAELDPAGPEAKQQ